MRSDRNAIAGRPRLAYAFLSNEATAVHTALLLIDLQNDYFPGGRYPLWNTGPVLAASEAAIRHAHDAGHAIVHVQHVAGADAPFFAPGSDGARIHPRILAAAPDAPVVVKRHADAFHETDLAALLASRGIERLLLAGMMTQNCITHTALSRAADRFHVTVLGAATTTVDPMIHRFALSALRTRIEVRDHALAVPA